MGACGSNVLDRLGPEFGKFVAAEKSKQLIDQKVKQAKDQLFKQSDSIKTETLNNISSAEQDSIQKVNNAVAEVDKTKPGALDKAAALQRKTKTSLFGSDEIRSRFGQLRNEVEQIFQDQERTLSNQIETQANQQKTLIDANKPKIPIYDQLPEEQRKKAFALGEKKYSDLIKSQNNQLSTQLSQTFNVDQYTNQLRSVQSTVNTAGITQSVDQIINSAKSGVTATSLFC